VEITANSRRSTEILTPLWDWLRPTLADPEETTTPETRMPNPLRRAVWGALTLLVLAGLAALELARGAVSYEVRPSPEGDLHIYRSPDMANGPLVIVAHGFGGSVQLMQTISRDLARAGFTAVAFDFYGHGRNPTRLSPQITTLDGTTAQLVVQTRRIVDAARAETGLDGPAALLGHSMATDILIRAAQDLPGIAAIVAISAYSDAITPDYPERLLLISGEWEHRLRAPALEAVRQIDPEAGEFDTATDGPMQRRAIYAPNTEHVAVLFSRTTLRETRAWLRDALGVAPQGAPHSQGLLLCATLAGLVLLAFPVARRLPYTAHAAPPLPARQFGAVLGGAALAGTIGVYVIPGTLFGTAALGHFLGFCLGWGAAALLLLRHFGRALYRPSFSAVALLLIWGAVFGLALDRYGAAFLPTGPRLGLMALLLVGTLPFMLADRLLLQDAPIWRRIAARIAPIVVLSSVMVAAPTQVGLMFTVLPVMVLFYLVYGTMGRAVARRAGPEVAGVGLGVHLAWAIAASTPLFQGG
jgi:pimeloyl-ACP methyl ester carboxylesterase